MLSFQINDSPPGVTDVFLSRHQQESFDGSATRFINHRVRATFLKTSHEESAQPLKTPSDQDDSNSLEDAAHDEHEYLRQRLRDELQREPTEAELDEWLRQHTEGY